MTVEEDETMIPMKEVIAKPKGMVNNCDHSASLGFFANLAKSGSSLDIVIQEAFHRNSYLDR